jgi:transposase
VVQLGLRMLPREKIGAKTAELARDKRMNQRAGGWTLIWGILARKKLKRIRRVLTNWNGK